MKVIWAVLCEGSSTDRETNNVSLFNILEEVHFPEPPDAQNEPDRSLVVPVRVLLMVLFARSNFAEGEVNTARLAIYTPGASDPELLPEFPVDLMSAHRNRTRLNIAGLPLRGEGDYLFQVQMLSKNREWQQLFEVPLHVTYLSNE